jgi:5-methyltetrahydrofolate--homocysteine methyltransferase
MDILQDPKTAQRIRREKLSQPARDDVFLRTTVGKDIAVGDEAGARSDVAANNRVPSPPFWGTRVLRDIPIDEVFDLLDLDELYRLQWGARGSGEQYDATIKNEFEPL